MAETADVELVVDTVCVSADVEVRVARALDRVDEAVITPPCTGSPLDVLTVPV